MSFGDWADDDVIDGGRFDPFHDGGGYDDASATREPGDSSSSGEIVVDVAPRVTADLNTQEREQHMRDLARWKIKRRHGKCANCHRARGSPGSRATGGDGRCRWCGSHVCSEDCFRKHDVKCDEHPPRDGGINPDKLTRPWIRATGGRRRALLSFWHLSIWK